MIAGAPIGAMPIAGGPPQFGSDSGPVTVTPGVATLTLTTFAPTVTVDGPRTVGDVTEMSVLGLPGFFRSASDDVAVVPSALALTLTTFAPTVSTPRVVTPGVLALTLTMFAPTVETVVPTINYRPTITYTTTRDTIIYEG
jgi:hypothetical protein